MTDARTLAIARAAQRELARREQLAFTHYTFPGYRDNWFHRSYCTQLDRFQQGFIRKLIVEVPPQHGKSEQCSRRMPAKILGNDPDNRIGLATYNQPFAAKFNRDVQRIIDTPEYQQLFPATQLNSASARTKTGAWLRNADEFEVVGRRGSLVTVGVGGGLTGRALDTLIIDDPYKDAKEAWSPAVRQSVQDWYDTVADSRLHNGSRQLITMTRWHPDDLVGVILRREPEEWTVVRYPAIKIGEPSELDPRQDGEALWEEQHSLERLLKKKKANPHVFQSLYQQDPRPAEGLLFPADSLQYFNMADLKGRTPDGIISVADVADTGKDYYCMLVGFIFDSEIFVVDAIFTQAQAEITEPLTLGAIERWQIQRSRFESNAGGRLYAKSIQEKCQNPYTTIEAVPSSTNKQTRILTASGAVKGHVHFLSSPPPDSDYEKFMNQFTGYQLQGKNDHDDAADTVTMLIDAARKPGFDFEFYS